MKSKKIKQLIKPISNRKKGSKVTKVLLLDDESIIEESGGE